jgi:hypothetical protein
VVGDASGVTKLGSGINKLNTEDAKRVCSFCNSLH